MFNLNNEYVNHNVSITYDSSFRKTSTSIGNIKFTNKKYIILGPEIIYQDRILLVVDNISGQILYDKAR
jgi:hypothetical protein